MMRPGDTSKSRISSCLQGSESSAEVTATVPAADDEVIITGMRESASAIGSGGLSGETMGGTGPLPPTPDAGGVGVSAKASSATLESGPSRGKTTGGPPSCQLPWKTVYYGVSAASICRGMGFAEVAHTFHRSYLCIRSFDCNSGVPKGIPGWAMAVGK